MSQSDPSSLTFQHSVTVNDGGAATAQRYRFQHTWAAIVCCALFDKTQDVEEVYCEHHEDVLVKHTDGTFSGHQVKSRDTDQPIWKANDTQIQVALGRFVNLEDKYPQQFRSFHFLTNHSLHVAKTAASISYILNQVNDATTVEDLPNPVKKWLRRLAATSHTSDIVAFGALKKTTASSELPKLSDAMTRLIRTLADSWIHASECSVEVLSRAAQRLIDECARASSLDHDQLLSSYLLATHPLESKVAARIIGKRMTLERVDHTLHDGMTSTATLTSPLDVRPLPDTGSTALLLRKLDTGGFSIVSSHSAEDLRDKADYLGIAWTKKIGRIKGLRRYDHIRSLVLNDASRAFEARKHEKDKFGPDMRETLRGRFQERRSNNEQLYDCSDEHLEGMAYSLTAQCKVQWSIDRPWEPI